jgi:hypothetical protein
MRSDHKRPSTPKRPATSARLATLPRRFLEACHFGSSPQLGLQKLSCRSQAPLPRPRKRC